MPKQRRSSISTLKIVMNNKPYSCLAGGEVRSRIFGILIGGLPVRLELMTGYS